MKKYPLSYSCNSKRLFLVALWLFGVTPYLLGNVNNLPIFSFLIMAQSNYIFRSSIALTALEVF